MRNVFLSKEQVFALLDGVAQAQQTRERHGRFLAMAKVAKEAGIHYTTAYQISRGGVSRYRPWVVEWRAQANGVAEKLPPLMHVPGKRVPPELAEYARALRAKGSSYSYISSKTGIPEGSLSTVLNGPRKEVRKRKQRETKVVAIRKIVATEDAPEAKIQRAEGKSTRLADAIEKYFDHEEEAVLSKLHERHESERQELADRQENEERGVREELQRKRDSVMDRIADFYTDPKNPEAE